MFGHEWALVDVETSGLRPVRDRVLSLAVVTVGPDGRTKGEFSTLLDPGCDPGPVHVHGLTPDRLKGSPKFDAVTHRLAEMLEGRVLVAHNAPFDYGFLAQEFMRAGARFPVGAAIVHAGAEPAAFPGDERSEAGHARRPLRRRE